MAMNGNSTKTEITYEDLIALEYEFDEAELEISMSLSAFAVTVNATSVTRLTLTTVRQSNALMQPLYAKRNALASRISSFWPLVFEQAPPDLDQYIQPSDSQLFADSLLSLEVERFEPDISPRSIKITMTFKENNPWFEDSSLEKKFYYRRTMDEWAGLVSEPVKIRWRQGKDLTNGLTDAAVRLWEARAKSENAKGDQPAKQADLKEHQDLRKRLEGNDPSQGSFFTLFGFVSDTRWVSAEESAEAAKTLKQKKQNRDLAENENKMDSQLEEEQTQIEQEVEICPQGDDIVTLIAEDVYPNAIKYFSEYLENASELDEWTYEFKASAQEQDDDEMSLSMEDEDDQEDDSEEEEEIDIRALVGKPKTKRTKEDNSGESPPPKARKT